MKIANPISKKNLLTGGLENVYRSIKDPLDAMKPPKAPGQTPEQAAYERLQTESLANLDAEENKRRKRLLLNVQGVRAYTGSPITRAAPSNTAGQGAAVAGRGGGGGGQWGAGGGASGYSFATAMGGRSLVP